MEPSIRPLCSKIADILLGVEDNVIHELADTLSRLADNIETAEQVMTDAAAGLQSLPSQETFERHAGSIKALDTLLLDTKSVLTRLMDFIDDNAKLEMTYIRLIRLHAIIEHKQLSLAINANLAGLQNAIHQLEAFLVQGLRQNLSSTPSLVPPVGNNGAGGKGRRLRG